VKRLLSIVLFASFLSSLVTGGVLDASGYTPPPIKAKPVVAVALVKPLPVPTTPVLATLAPIPVPQPVQTAVAAPVAQTPVTSAPMSSCGDNTYANYIYEHESGCRLTAVNASSGDYGLGQSGGGLEGACPDWQTDYACQNEFFTNYADSRYGSWAAAYDFWTSNGWW
jgi:hypothetical protein